MYVYIQYIEKTATSDFLEESKTYNFW